MPDFTPEDLKGKIIPLKEAAEEKDCTRQTIRNAVERGDLHSIRAGRYLFIVRDDTFDAFQVQETGGRLHKSYKSSKSCERE